MERIIRWLESCGFSRPEAVGEARRMVEANRWDGAEKCSTEFAIETILADLEEMYGI